MKKIVDALLREAKRIAAKERTTIRVLLEERLRRALEEHRKKPRFRLRDASYGQGGLQADVREGTWERLRDLIYMTGAGRDRGGYTNLLVHWSTAGSHRGMTRV